MSSNIKLENQRQTPLSSINRSFSTNTDFSSGHTGMMKERVNSFKRHHHKIKKCSVKFLARVRCEWLKARNKHHQTKELGNHPRKFLMRRCMRNTKRKMKFGGCRTARKKFYGKMRKKLKLARHFLKQWRMKNKFHNNTRRAKRMKRKLGRVLKKEHSEEFSSQLLDAN